MKYILFILILMMSHNICTAQRDTLNYSQIISDSSLVLDEVTTDSSYTFSYTLEDYNISFTYGIVKTLIFKDSLDSILNVLQIQINQKRYFVEEYFRMYQQSNSSLWNIQRHHALLEELYDSLYNP